MTGNWAGRENSHKRLPATETTADVGAASELAPL